MSGGMIVLRRLAVCLAFLVAFVPRIVPALELGPIKARSALYEPLDARIPVVDAQSGDMKGLNVVLGSPAQFELAGVARLQHLNLLEFVVVEQGGGRGYIQVRTDEPIIEPSLTFLIDVDWPRGRTVRGYRLQLTPSRSRASDMDRVAGTAQPAQPASDTGTAGTAPATTGMEYGPVREAETLWSIAARTRPDQSVSVQRMMLAILEANPRAFEFANVNALNAGTTLRIPTRDEIGPDDLSAAIAEVQRQHSAWASFRDEGREAPTPPPAAPETPPRDSETPPRDSETGQEGRIEVVSPESTTTPSREEDAQVATLRKELALAMEEADAGRRENDELKLRLAETEKHIEELNRLVELKNKEIAALRSELDGLARTTPPAVAEPEEVAPAPAAAPAGETKPVLEPEEAESKPVVAPETEEAKPVPAPAATEPMAVPAPAEAEPKSATAEAEPKSLPFGLGSLPVNPVFLVGGAGLLLILLGVVALLRRRRASAGEDEVGEELALEAAEPSPSGEDNLLLELEAVAADLAEEQDEPTARSSRAAPVAATDADMKRETRTQDATDSGLEDIVEERLAELWRDDHSIERDRGKEIEVDDDSSEITFDIDALTADDSDLKFADDDGSDELDIGDLADLADLAAERETGPDRPAGGTPGNLDLLFSRHEAQAADSGTPATDAEDVTEFDPAMLDEVPDDALPATRELREPRDSEVGTAGTPTQVVDVEPASAAERSVGDAATPHDAGAPDRTAQTLLDESADSGESEVLSLDEFGEDEVQTKIDLAQVYIEMGDTESARGFLEAVLAEGDAEQREAAREMLSRLG